MRSRCEPIDLRQTNRHAAQRRQQRAATDRAVAEMHRRAQRRRQRRDQCRLLALLTGTGVLG